MSPSHPTATPETCTAPQIQLSLGWQVGLSVLLVIHLLAICLPPMALATRSVDGPSPAVAPLFNGLRPYIDSLNLNHAYFFFAPDPGPSHIAKYEIDFADGRKTMTGQFPDRNEHWPRLLYHRHFMLAETLNDRFSPPTGEPEPQRGTDDSRRAARIYNRLLARWQRLHEDWKASREQYVALRKSVEHHLLATHGGSEVRLSRWEHRQLGPDEFQYDNLSLDAAETFSVLPESPTVETLPWNAPRKP